MTNSQFADGVSCELSGTLLPLDTVQGTAVNMGDMPIFIMPKLSDSGGICHGDRSHKLSIKGKVKKANANEL